MGYFEEGTLGLIDRVNCTLGHKNSPGLTEDDTLGHPDRADCTLVHKGFLARPLTEDDTKDT